MASVQQAQVAHLNDKNKKAIIHEMVKEAKALAENNRDAGEEQLAMVAGAMKNSQERELKLAKTINAAGTFLVEPSEILPKDDGGSFVHRASPIVPIIVHGVPVKNTDSKAAVIYGANDAASPKLGYLLAWYKAQNNSNGKVYVKAGDLDELKKLEWSDIEPKLNASGTESDYMDSATGAVAAAKIEYFAGNLAILGANFDRVIPPQ